MKKKSKKGKISDTVYRWISDYSRDGFMCINSSNIELLINKLYKIK